MSLMSRSTFPAAKSMESSGVNRGSTYTLMWFTSVGTKSEAYSNTDHLVNVSQTYGSDGWNLKPIPE